MPVTGWPNGRSGKAFPKNFHAPYLPAEKTVTDQFLACLLLRLPLATDSLCLGIVPPQLMFNLDMIYLVLSERFQLRRAERLNSPI